MKAALCKVVIVLQCGLLALTGALARGADAGADGIEGRAPADGAPPRKPVELAPENPAELPPRLNPAFVPIGARALICPIVIGAGLRGIEAAVGIAFTARKLSRIGIVPIREFRGILAIPARAGIAPLLPAIDTRSAATLPTVGANILPGAFPFTPPRRPTLDSNIVEAFPFCNGSPAANAACFPSTVEANSRTFPPPPSRFVVSTRRGGVGIFPRGGVPFFTGVLDPTPAAPKAIPFATPKPIPLNPEHPLAICSNISGDVPPNPAPDDGHHPT